MSNFTENKRKSMISCFVVSFANGGSLSKLPKALFQTKFSVTDGGGYRHRCCCRPSHVSNSASTSKVPQIDKKTDKKTALEASRKV